MDDIDIITETITGVSRGYLLAHPDYDVPPEVRRSLIDALRRYRAGEPCAYILGEASFFGLRYKVGPGCLIPRGDTEFLVERVISLLPENGCFADLCTGSGCIAWTLAMELPGAQVVGVDISDAALDVARGQGVDTSSRGHLPPEFARADVLALPEEFPGAPFDVITANPPYVKESEKAAMHRNVLEHEPELALFVPDDDPLVFYRAIAQWTLRFLKDGGVGIAEINEALGEATAEVFRAAGLKKVAVLSDLSGRDRFVTFYK